MGELGTLIPAAVRHGGRRWALDTAGWQPDVDQQAEPATPVCLMQPLAAWSNHMPSPDT